MNIQPLLFAGQTSFRAKDVPNKNNVDIEGKHFTNLAPVDDPFAFEDAKAINASIDIIKKQEPIEKINLCEEYPTKTISTSIGDIPFKDAHSVFSTILSSEQPKFKDANTFVRISRPLHNDPFLALQFVEYEKGACIDQDLLARIEMYGIKSSDIKPGVITMLDSIGSKKVSALSDEALIDTLGQARYIGLKTLNTFNAEQIKMLSDYLIPECKAFFKKMISGGIHP
jgi:hypothetical protein